MFNFFKAKDRFVGIIKDIRNYIYIWSTIKESRDTEPWNRFKLRYDYIGRIYTVINLRAEDFGEADPMIQQIRFREKSESLYEYITELNLHEIVSPIVEYIPGTYSYLVKFVPIFKWFKISWLIGFIFKLSLTWLFLYLIGQIFNLDYFWNILIDFLQNNKILR